MNEAAIYKRINKLLDGGTLVRIGQGLYCFNNKRRYDYSLEEPLTHRVLDVLKKSFPDNLEWVIKWVIKWVINHLTFPK